MGDFLQQEPLSGFHLRLIVEGGGVAASVPVEAVRFLSKQQPTSSSAAKADRDVVIHGITASDAGQLERALTLVCDYLQHELLHDRDDGGPVIEPATMFPLPDGKGMRDLTLVLNPSDVWYADWISNVGTLAQVQLVWTLARQLGIVGLEHLCEMQVACILSIASNDE